jgi:catechol 2,3-dioxygenase-like lactoylglutathione lyase family enzyme
MHIQEVILETASLARTRLFYGKTLELPVVREDDASVSFGIGKSVLTFRAITGSKPYYHIAFNITNNRFSDGFEWINNKLDILPMENGIPIAVYPDWNAESFYFLDNNGSILEFITRFDLPYHSSDPFSVADIREISEVGAAVSDVGETTDRLIKDYSIPIFSKSRHTPHFAALGDDLGLFIISHAGRPWVPTNKPSATFPLTVVADGKTILF